ncbi:hypothetical protein O3P69_004187 [Scylla paramamosain]|uniref:Uncharacterized protein n=1 Tax=Scylla paramamosain TaxID=85552 RepID=A0AAW0UL19_SCYPA
MERDADNCLLDTKYEQRWLNELARPLKHVLRVQTRVQVAVQVPGVPVQKIQDILGQLCRCDVSRAVWLRGARGDACERRRIHASVRTYVSEALLVNPDVRSRSTENSTRLFPQCRSYLRDIPELQSSIQIRVYASLCTVLTVTREYVTRATRQESDVYLAHHSSQVRPFPGVWPAPPYASIYQGLTLELLRGSAARALPYLAPFSEPSLLLLVVLLAALVVLLEDCETLLVKFLRNWLMLCPSHPYTPMLIDSKPIQCTSASTSAYLSLGVIGASD